MAQMLEVTIQGRYLQQQIINRLTFVTDNDNAGTANALGLVEAMGYVAGFPTAPLTASMLHRFLQAQSEYYQMEQILARNLFVVTDFFTVAVSGAGWDGETEVGADGQLPFVAAKLQTNRVRTDIRRGSLALTPLSEEFVGVDGIITESYLTLLQTLCDELNLPMSTTDGGDSTNFLPAVFQKEEYPVPKRTDGRTAWRYYADPAVQLAHAAYPVSWFPKNRVTSQTSRRIGKGA